MPLAPGTRLSHYEIITLIGEGGMGEVYKARDSRLDRTVAIKVIGAGAGADPIMRERLLREARAASSLNHPHICTVHDVHDGDQPFIAMEWIDGESLAQRLTGSGSGMPVVELTRLASQIADALDAAHASGVVHRDLKPANLFVTKRGDAKILDFGLAQISPLAVAAAGHSADQATMAAQRKLTNRGDAVGTVSYMAPEQARGERVDARSDLFSFGVVLYEMATGRSAFASPTTALTFDAILNRQPPPSRTVNAEVPPALDQIIGRLLAKEPSSRYQSARVLRDELQALAQTLRRDQSSGKTTIAPSIAVLPFTNLSPEPENEYIADGITEEIINTLAQIPGLQVAPRTSSFSFKGKTPELAEVAARLRVAQVLTGSVRKAGTRLRVTAQLVNAHDAVTIWSERYDRQTDDIFQIQDEIATAIAEKLRVGLSADGPIARRGTDNVDAYELYLKGRFLVNQRGAGIGAGLESFERALAIDPGYALAHAGLGAALALLGFYGYAPAYEAMPRARRAAQNAIALDASLAEPHAVLEFVSYAYEWDWANCEREFERAVVLNPNVTIAHAWRSLKLAAHGAFDEASACAERVAVIEPLSALAHAIKAVLYGYAGRLADALESGRRCEELDSQVWIHLMACSSALGNAGRLEEATEMGERCVVVSQRHPWALFLLAQVHERADRSGEVARILDEIRDRSRSGYVQPLAMAMALACCDRVDESYEYWERAYREHDSLTTWSQWPSLPKAFATDPRFGGIMRRVGLVPGPHFGGGR